MYRKKVKKILSVIVIGAVAAISAGCGSSDSDSNPFQKGLNSAFVVTSDYSTGSYSAINLDDMTATNDLPGSTGIVHSDCVVRYYQNKIYLINRLGMDNITVLDVDDLSTSVNQFSVGNGTNPHSMAFVNAKKAFVALYNSNDLLIVDPSDIGNEISGKIDLSGFSDAINDPTDGLLEVEDLVLVGGKLFVSLQRIDRDKYWAASSKGLLVVINAVTNEIIDVDPAIDGVQGITLTGMNPGYMEYDPTSGKILVSEAGDYLAADGGIEVVDPYTYDAEGFIISESDELGTAIGAFAVIDHSIFAGIAAGYGSPVIMEFNYDKAAKTCTKVKDVFTATAYVPCLTADGFDRLIIPDRDTVESGIRFYDTATGDLSDPIYVGLPPSAVITF